MERAEGETETTQQVYISHLSSLFTEFKVRIQDSNITCARNKELS